MRVAKWGCGWRIRFDERARGRSRMRLGSCSNSACANYRIHTSRISQVFHGVALTSKRGFEGPSQPPQQGDRIHTSRILQAFNGVAQISKRGHEAPSGVEAQSPCFARPSTCYLPAMADLSPCYDPVPRARQFSPNILLFKRIFLRNRSADRRFPCFVPVIREIRGAEPLAYR